MIHSFVVNKLATEKLARMFGQEATCENPKK